MTALSAEVLWTRHLALLLGGTVYTFALIVAVFLAGIGLGSAAGAAAGRRGDARAALAAVQALLCVAMAGGAYALAESLPYWPIDVTLPTRRRRRAAARPAAHGVRRVAGSAALGRQLAARACGRRRCRRAPATRDRASVCRQYVRRDRRRARHDVRAGRRPRQPTHAAAHDRRERRRCARAAARQRGPRHATPRRRSGGNRDAA